MSDGSDIGCFEPGCQGDSAAVGTDTLVNCPVSFCSRHVEKWADKNHVEITERTAVDGGIIGKQVIGYVVGDTEEAVTLCTECEPGWDDDITRSEIRDGPHYGDQVPYPECFLCEEVLRNGGPKVYVSANKLGNGRKLHVDDDCPQLRQSDVLEKPIEVYPEAHRDWCDRCTDDS